MLYAFKTTNGIETVVTERKAPHAAYYESCMFSEPLLSFVPAAGDV
jgi:hypothetical protein